MINVPQETFWDSVYKAIVSHTFASALLCVGYNIQDLQKFKGIYWKILQIYYCAEKFNIQHNVLFKVFRVLKIQIFKNFELGGPNQEKLRHPSFKSNQEKSRASGLGFFFSWANMHIQPLVRKTDHLYTWYY